LISTKRLRLVPISTPHLSHLADMNADPEVMLHFPSVMSTAQTEAYFTRIQAHWAKNGFGLFALQLKANDAFLGFTGLTHPNYQTPFTPCVEVGWRLQRAAWGKGFAFEAAHACLNWGFTALNLSEIVSFTSRVNLRSIALMRRLGMQSDPLEDFRHPMLEKSHPLSWHVLYRLQNPIAP